MRELMEVQPGPELDQRTEMWLEEVDEFGMMYMGLGMCYRLRLNIDPTLTIVVNATEVPAGGGELRPEKQTNEI
jgi:hypothetical protein